MKKWLMMTGLVSVILFLFAFSKNTGEKINWISMQELNEQYAKDPKPVIIDIYTDWCGWCKQMDKTTYKDDKLASYINSHYYAVKYNAESRESITFNKKTYNYNSQYRTNELAIYLTGGQLSYPTTVLMTGTDGQPAPLPGYMKPKQMEAPLKFFGEKISGKQTFVEFYKKFRNEW